MLASSGGQILAGGTDFFPSLGDRPVTGTVVDISGLGELKGVVKQPKHIRIGGLTTWTEVVKTPLPRGFDGLKAAAREIGGIQIQNRATELVSQAGVRRVALADFIVGNRKTLRRPGEILSQIFVPRRVENAASTFLKLGARRYLVISIAMVAAVIRMDSGGRVTDARVAIGSCSVVARRLPDLEHALIGASVASVGASPTLGSLATADHLKDLSPVSDVRATAAYRCDAALRLVQRALDACAGSS